MVEELPLRPKASSRQRVWPPVRGREAKIGEQLGISRRLRKNRFIRRQLDSRIGSDLHESGEILNDSTVFLTRFLSHFCHYNLGRLV